MSGLLGVCAGLLRSGSTPGRAHRGLYAGKQLYMGYKVTDDKKTPTKNPRTWKPNVVSKRFTSEVLGRELKLKVTTGALRWIDKAGGFDNYILNTSDEKLDSRLGSALKREMQNVLAEKAKQQ